MIPPSSMFRCSSLVPAKISMIAEPQSGKWECCLIIHSSYAALTVLIPNFIEISCSERFENLTSYFVIIYIYQDIPSPYRIFTWISITRYVLTWIFCHNKLTWIFRHHIFTWIFRHHIFTRIFYHNKLTWIFRQHLQYSIYLDILSQQTYLDIPPP